MYHQIRSLILSVVFFLLENLTKDATAVLQNLTCLSPVYCFTYQFIHCKIYFTCVKPQQFWFAPLESVQTLLS